MRLPRSRAWALRLPMLDRRRPQEQPAADLAWLTRTWDAQHPGLPPLGHRLRGGERWVRFHSLPGSKRYAEDAGERAEALRRHHAVLDALTPRGTELVVLTCSWSWSGRATARERTLDAAAPGARLWRTFRPEPGSSGAYMHAFVGRAVNSPRALERLLRLVADDETEGVLLSEPDLAWLYLPYDGGADVISRSVEERDALRERFAAWLSPLPSGL